MRLSFHILRSLSPLESGPLLEAMPIDQPERRVLLWPGTMPSGDLPPGSRYGKRVASGVTNSRPVWIEERPAGPLISDLPLPLAPDIADHIMLQLCHAVMLLHHSGQAHGDLTVDRVALDSLGRPVLLGCGRQRSSHHTDLAALAQLYQAMGGKRPLSPTAGLESCLQLLKQTAAVDMSTLNQLALQPVSQPERPSRIEVMIASSLAGLSIDEVEMDVGKDDRGHGLLDEWTGGTDEEVQERTGTLSLDALAEQRRLALLSRLGLEPEDHKIPLHIQELDPAKLDIMKTELLSEGLDPLPSPGSLMTPLQGELSPSGEEITGARYGSSQSTALLDDITAAQIENTESFASTSEVTRIQRRPTPSAAPEPQPATTVLSRPLVWIGAIGWILALISLTLFWLQ